MIFSDSGALFNSDRSRRFLLWRRTPNCTIKSLAENPEKLFVLFIGLNPSIADEERLDPTVTRCYNYAKRWGFSYLLMGNLYSKVSTDPKGVDFEVVDPENWDHLAEAVEMAEKVVVCWGANANENVASSWLYLQTKPLFCLGKNQNGSPKHPLYLRGDVLPQVYLASANARFKAGEWE